VGPTPSGDRGVFFHNIDGPMAERLKVDVRTLRRAGPVTDRLREPCPELSPAFAFKPALRFRRAAGRHGQRDATRSSAEWPSPARIP
jgi:hypothetical protein